jgi:pyruvate dehydrogenase phosphatase
VLYNLHPGFHASSPWEEFLVRNHTPPYISAQADVVHRRLVRGAHSQHFLVLCTDGFTDISANGDPERAADEWTGIVREAIKARGDNLALDLLQGVLGGQDLASVSRALMLELDYPWLDDITIMLLSL